MSVLIKGGRIVTAADEHVAHVVVRGGDDPPTLDEHGHARSPFSRLCVVYDARSAASNDRGDRWAAALGHDIRGHGTRGDRRGLLKEEHSRPADRQVAWR